MRGLLGRRSLPAGEGMLLQPAASIHTAFMRFPFDAVFVDGTLRVVKLVETLRPWRIASARHARGVVELSAGEIARRGIKLDDQLGVVEISDHLGIAETNAGWNAASWSSVADGALQGNARKAVPSNVLMHPRLITEDRLSKATRVLVVGTDRRFRSVAAALLTRRGCVVTLQKGIADLAQLARRERAEVVVLDAGASLTAAAREAALLETLDPPVGVVVVAEDSAHGLSAFPVLRKWGSFDGLYGAIEQARPVRARSAFDAG